MGDGKHLSNLLRERECRSTYFVGIEINKTLYDEAIGRVKGENVTLINDRFENIITAFESESVDQMIMILPDPAYIDSHYYKNWIKFYPVIFLKLKKLGTLEIVTEIIDELLQPVTEAAYRAWADWISMTFVKMGFKVEEILNEAPSNYSSTCLDRFKCDPERIRLLTIRLSKP